MIGRVVLAQLTQNYMSDSVIGYRNGKECGSGLSSCWWGRERIASHAQTTAAKETKVNLSLIFPDTSKHEN